MILIDDGLATGATMKAAVAALRQLRPNRIVVAVPVAAADTCRELAAEVDEVVCLSTPEPFHAVGLWYEQFSQTTDQEVHDLLEALRTNAPSRLTETDGCHSCLLPSGMVAPCSWATKIFEEARLAPDRLAALKFAPVKSAPRRSAMRMAPCKLACERSASWRSASVRSAP